MGGDYGMKLNFIESLNELIARSYLEMSDTDVVSLMDEDGVPASEEIGKIQEMLSQQVKASRARQLTLARERFAEKTSRSHKSIGMAPARTIDSMIRDIVDALQNNANSVPQGILMAFRNQQEQADDSSIHEIWNDLVNLGLIIPDDSGDEE